MSLLEDFLFEITNFFNFFNPKKQENECLIKNNLDSEYNTFSFTQTSEFEISHEKVILKQFEDE